MSSWQAVSGMAGQPASTAFGASERQWAPPPLPQLAAPSSAAQAARLCADPRPGHTTRPSSLLAARPAVQQGVQSSHGTAVGTLRGTPSWRSTPPPGQRSDPGRSTPPAASSGTRPPGGQLQHQEQHQQSAPAAAPGHGAPDGTRPGAGEVPVGTDLATASSDRLSEDSDLARGYRLWAGFHEPLGPRRAAQGKVYTELPDNEEEGLEDDMPERPRNPKKARAAAGALDDDADQLWTPSRIASDKKPRRKQSTTNLKPCTFKYTSRAWFKRLTSSNLSEDRIYMTEPVINLWKTELSGLEHLASQPSILLHVHATEGGPGPPACTVKLGAPERDGRRLQIGQLLGQLGASKDDWVLLELLPERSTEQGLAVKLSLTDRLPTPEELPGEPPSKRAAGRKRKGQPGSGTAAKHQRASALARQDGEGKGVGAEGEEELQSGGSAEDEATPPPQHRQTPSICRALATPLHPEQQLLGVRSPHPKDPNYSVKVKQHRKEAHIGLLARQQAAVVADLVCVWKEAMSDRSDSLDIPAAELNIPAAGYGSDAELLAQLREIATPGHFRSFVQAAVLQHAGAQLPGAGDEQGQHGQQRGQRQGEAQREQQPGRDERAAGEHACGEQPGGQHPFVDEQLLAGQVQEALDAQQAEQEVQHAQQAEQEAPVQQQVPEQHALGSVPADSMAGDDGGLEGFPPDLSPLAARLVQRWTGQAAGLLKGGAEPCAAALLRAVQLLALSGLGGDALQAVASRWGELPLSAQQYLCATLTALARKGGSSEPGDWKALEGRLHMALKRAGQEGLLAGQGPEGAAGPQALPGESFLLSRATSALAAAASAADPSPEGLRGPFADLALGDWWPRLEVLASRWDGLSTAEQRWAFEALLVAVAQEAWGQVEGRLRLALALAAGVAAPAGGA
ncbi:hypothetical protein ABPG75_009688 [Micractinium tetrahymenae]